MRKRLIREGLLAAMLLAVVLVPEMGSAAERFVPGTGEPETLFDQAWVCHFQREALIALHDAHLQDGSVRWTCADVAGIASPSFGQEYCESTPVSQGKIVHNIEEVEPGAKLQCVFTTAFADAQRNDAQLLATMASEANLGSKVHDKSIVRMDTGFNSHAAAMALIASCDGNAATTPDDEVRQAACFQAAFGKQGDDLKNLCRGKDLGDKAQWEKAAALGARIRKLGEEDYDAQQDMISCLATKRSGGVTWRKSDSLLCGRVTRASKECGCDYNAIPASVDGFTLSGPLMDVLPAGCRYAKVDGADYKQIAICELSAGDLEDAQMSATDPRTLCHGRYAALLLVKVPLRAFEKAGTCKSQATAFCAAYSGKAR